MTRDISENIQSYYTGTVRIKHSEFEKNSRLNPVHLVVDNPDLIIEEALQASPAPDVKVSKRIVFPSRIYIGSTYKNALGIGVDFQAEESFLLHGAKINSGRIPEPDERGVLLGAKFADKLGVSTGDAITILTSTAARGSNAVTLKVTGTALFKVSDFTNTAMMMPFERASDLMKMKNSTGEILFKFPGVDEKTIINFTQKLQDSLRDKGYENLDISYWKDISSTYSMFASFEAVYFIFAVFFLLLGCTVIINTAMMVIYERIKEIGTFKAIGMKDSSIVRLFFLESFYLGLISSIAGTVIGTAVSLIFYRTGINFKGSMEGFDIEISNILYPYPDLKSVAAVFLFSVFISSVSTFIPSLKALQIKTVNALKHG